MKKAEFNSVFFLLLRVLRALGVTEKINFLILNSQLKSFPFFITFAV